MSHQYAPVAPLHTLETLNGAKALGHYQLLIAPIVLDNYEAYRSFFKHNPDQLVMLDNGVIELGYPLGIGELYQAARGVGASVVVLPDTIDDGSYTAKQAIHAASAFREFGPHGSTAHGLSPISLMGVVQGTTLEECLACAKSHVEEAQVDWLAVPRGLTPNLRSRVQLTVTLAEAYELPVHILGFSDNLADDIAAATCHPRVRGIDAATTAWLPDLLPDEPPSDPTVSQSWGRRPTNFWQAGPPDALVQNVVTVRRWLRAAKIARTERDGLADPMDP